MNKNISHLIKAREDRKKRIFFYTYKKEKDVVNTEVIDQKKLQNSIFLIIGYSKDFLPEKFLVDVYCKRDIALLFDNGLYYLPSMIYNNLEEYFEVIS